MTPGARRDALSAKRQMIGAARRLEMLAVMLRASGHVRSEEVAVDCAAAWQVVERLALMLEER